MPSWRARESRRQARVREDNESTAQACASASAAGTGHFFRCECGAEDCARAITLTQAEYESVRAHATRFVLAPNHENPESERVIEENTRFAVVEAVTGDEVKLARKSDPRRGIRPASPRLPPSDRAVR